MTHLAWAVFDTTFVQAVVVHRCETEDEARIWEMEHHHPNYAIGAWSDNDETDRNERREF